MGVLKRVESISKHNLLKCKHRYVWFIILFALTFAKYGKLYKYVNVLITLQIISVWFYTLSLTRRLYKSYIADPATRMGIGLVPYIIFLSKSGMKYVLKFIRMR